MNLKRLATVAAAAVVGLSALNAQQPYGGCWHPDDVKDWSPETDPDARFNRSRVPLAKRFKESPIMKANEYQWYEGELCNATILYPTCSQCPSQGDYNFTGYQPTYWQYMDKLVYWAGSASEGIIIPPPAPVVDAAHAQGVKVLGQIFFPPTYYGGTYDWVVQMCTNENGSYVYAKKLYEIAAYMGFDGWFINSESGGHSGWNGWIREYMSYAEAGGQPWMEIQWYDARNLVDTEKMKTHINTSQFLEYGAAGDHRDEAEKIGCTVEQTFSKIYAGVQVVNSGYDGWGGQLRAAMPKEGHVGSLDLFCPEERLWKDWVKSLLNTPDNCGQKAYDAVNGVFRYEQNMWVNVKGDPSYLTPEKETSWLDPTPTWPGLSNAMCERSAIQSMPFTSSMCVGVGKHRFVHGKKRATRDWYHSGVQSVLPTWRWWIENRGELKVAVDWDDAWNVGSSFKISGTLSAGDHLMRLYKTMIPVAAGGTLRVVYKGGKGVVLEARLSTESSVNPDVTLQPASVKQENGWDIAEYDLSSLTGKTIYMIALNIKAEKANPDFSMNLGELAVLPAGYAPEALKVTNFTTTSTLGEGKNDLRLFWNFDWSDDFDHFDIYIKDGSGISTLVGQTRGEAFYVPAFDRHANDGEILVRLEAVMKNGESYAVGELNPKYPQTGVPVVTLLLDKSYIKAGETATITARGTGNPSGFEWVLPEGLEFADGTSATSNPVKVKATANGRHVLTVKATNEAGTSSTEIQAIDVLSDEEYAKVENVVLGKTVVDFSGSTNTTETPERIIDGVAKPGDASQKWCNVSAENWVVFDLENAYRIYGFKIYDCNYGPESGDQIRNYKIALSDDGLTWTNVVEENEVSDQALKSAFIAPVKARFVKLIPEVQGTMRIWEFEVYGIDDTKFNISVDNELALDINGKGDIIVAYDLNGDKREANFGCTATTGSNLVELGNIVEDKVNSRFVVPVKSGNNIGRCEIEVRLTNGTSYKIGKVKVSIDNDALPNVLSGLKATVRHYEGDSNMGGVGFDTYTVSGLTDGDKANEALSEIEKFSSHSFDLWTIFECPDKDGWDLTKVKVFFPDNNTGTNDNDVDGVVSKDITIACGNTLELLTPIKTFENIGETAGIEYLLPEARNCKYIVIKSNLNPYFYPSLAEVEAYVQPGVPDGPLELTGWTKDIIAEKAGYKVTNYSFHDDFGTFYSTGVSESGAIADDSRELVTANGTKFRLAPYDGNNALPMSKNGDNELTLAAPTDASKLQFLAFSPLRKPTMEVVLNYTDGTSSDAAKFNIPYSHIDEKDGNEGKGEAVFALGIYDVDNEGVANPNWDGYYNLYEYEMDADPTKKIKSIIVRRAATLTGGTPILLAVSHSKGSTSGIEDIDRPSADGSKEIVAIYNLQGMPVKNPVAGVYVVRYSDGSSRKILVK
ncbi:discoidin domain-containing protein [uncultured Muribaculum sp.]|uniref:endo-beta-N-acetylglucosaminidase n=1 Tax=uncultured Muribaculum sp. TaxID=1918613 RepID=UPI0025DE8C34|nr:discoidin domain-containing protein [uncultured Muribaculum sp.]